MLKELKRKKVYLGEVIDSLLRQQWDIDISIEGRRNIKEGIRIEYDRLCERLDAASLRLEEEKKKEQQDQKIMVDLTRLIEIHEPEVKKMAGQMKAMDWDIDHVKEMMPAEDLKKLIEGADKLDEKAQTRLFKAVDIIEKRDKGGLIQQKEALIVYRHLVEGSRDKI